jgi:light-regulated signal transduction histidine kinase (bacteriophytochrome)
MNAAPDPCRSEAVALTNCEREPLRTPGLIQPDGVLLAAPWPTGVSPT